MGIDLIGSMIGVGVNSLQNISGISWQSETRERSQQQVAEAGAAYSFSQILARLQGTGVNGSGWNPGYPEAQGRGSGLGDEGHEQRPAAGPAGTLFPDGEERANDAGIHLGHGYRCSSGRCRLQCFDHIRLFIMYGDRGNGIAG